MFASKNKRFSLTRWVINLVLCTAFVAVVIDVRAARAVSGQNPTEVLHVPELDTGFHLLYELKPVEARAQFEAWQKSHSQDPLGYASEAASYLFEECYRQGVLTSEFFLDDKRFLGKIPLKPDPRLRAAFFASNQRAEDLAQLRLKTNPDDPNALFAMSLSLGMQADYASLIDKHQVDSLKKIREADTYSNKLLKVVPDAADAYLGLGTANYIIGSLPGPKKFVLGFAGIHGDKKKGIEQLETAAKHGHYLRPFAKILLALTALREKRPEVARAQLTELVAEFPENALFVSELAKLNVSSAGTSQETFSMECGLFPPIPLDAYVRYRTDKTMCGRVGFLPSSAPPGEVHDVFAIRYFLIDSSQLLWRAAATSLEDARARIEALGATHPGEYLAFNQQTGTKVSASVQSKSELNSQFL